MEAWRFGFSDEPPAHKYDPTDEDIVAHYLLPRATGVRNPHAHAVVDGADLCSCPPWELLRRHGHGNSDHAFFFTTAATPRDRVCRAVRPAAPGGAGGSWSGQKGVVKELVLVRGGDGDGEPPEMTIRFRRYSLTYLRDGVKGSTGWVMHEYYVLHPPRLAANAAAVARIKITDGAKNAGVRKRQLREEDAVIARASWAAAAALAPGPDQPGPSNYYDFVPDNYFVSESDNYYGHAAAVVANVAGEGTSGGGGYYMDLLHAVVGGGIDYDIGGADDQPAAGPGSYLDDLHDDDDAGAAQPPGSDEIVRQEEGGVGDYYFDDGSYYVDDGNVYFDGEDIISQYLNQDVIGSTAGDYFTADENKDIYEPPPVSDTPAAIVDDEDTKKEE